MAERAVAADGRPWDLLVVGGGTAGLVGATTAAGLGARVLLVERDRTGGDCLWTGCVPSKALIAAASVAAQARDGSRYGVRVTGVEVDLAGVMAHVRRAVRTIAPVDSPEALESAGVRVLAGDLRFTGDGEAEVDGAAVRFRQALVATGSAPALPDLPGLVDADPLTSETVWGLETLPARLVVLGGGTIGCELAQAFARLGAGVALLEVGPRLLLGEDPAAAAVVERALVADGVRVVTGATPTAVADGAVVLPTARGTRSTGCWWPRGASRAPPGSAWRRWESSSTATAAWSSTGRCAPPTRGSGPPATSRRTPGSPTSPGCTPASRRATPCSASADGRTP